MRLVGGELQRRQDQEHCRHDGGRPDCEVVVDDEETQKASHW